MTGQPPTWTDADLLAASAWHWPGQFTVWPSAAYPCRRGDRISEALAPEETRVARSSYTATSSGRRWRSAHVRSSRETCHEGSRGLRIPRRAASGVAASQLRLGNSAHNPTCSATICGVCPTESGMSYGQPHVCGGSPARERNTAVCRPSVRHVAPSHLARTGVSVG
jgi:hypothetical protein